MTAHRLPNWDELRTFVEVAATAAFSAQRDGSG
jgi:hypothetical protein